MEEREEPIQNLNELLDNHNVIQSEMGVMFDELEHKMKKFAGYIGILRDEKKNQGLPTPIEDITIYQKCSILKKNEIIMHDKLADILNFLSHVI